MGWLEDKYCGATFHLIKSIRDGICKKWDEEHGKLPAPAPSPDTPASSPSPTPNLPSSTSPSSPSSQQPSSPAPAPQTPSSPASPAPPAPVSNGNRQGSTSLRSTKFSNPASTSASTNTDIVQSTADLPDEFSPTSSSSSSSTSNGMPFPSSGDNPFPTDNNNNTSASAQNAGQIGQTGSMTAVYIGVGVAAAIVVALFVFLGIRVARNRRRRQEEAVAAYAIRNGAQRDMPPPNLVPSPSNVAYMREADIETRASLPPSPAAPAPPASPAMMPLYETRNVVPAPLNNDPFIFDATANMAAAGLDHLNNNGPAPMPQQSDTYSPFVNDSVSVTYTNPNYGQHDTVVSPGMGVAIATSTGVALDANNHDHDYHLAEVPDDVFGEHIYGDASMMTNVPITNNVVHSADLATASSTGINDAGYCLDSLRADSYMNQHAINGDNQLNVGTYGSDAVYLDATEEFPHVPAISPDDTRLKTT